MKKHLLLLMVLYVCFTLVGCTGGDAEKGRIDIEGIITEVDHEGYRILVDDKDEGLIWVTLHENGDIANYDAGQDVAVWVKGGIRESSPAQADALNIELLTP